MDIGLLVLLGLLAITIIIAFYRGGWQQFFAGLKRAWGTLASMWWRLLLGFILGGFIQVLIPHTLIAEWLGPESGILGLFIGAYAGLIMTGGSDCHQRPILMGTVDVPKWVIRQFNI